MARPLNCSAVTLVATLAAMIGYSAACPNTAIGQESGRPGVRSSNTRWPIDNEQVEHQTLEGALLLAGRSIATLPITLVSVIPAGASAGVQGWTTEDAAGKGEQIFLYTGSGTFRCARPSRENYQCVLKLASVLVHEAWHFRHGGNEANAYAAQIVFLMGNGGALDQIADVRMSSARAVAAARAAIKAARKGLP